MLFWHKEQVFFGVRVWVDGEKPLLLLLQLTHVSTSLAMECLCICVCVECSMFVCLVLTTPLSVLRVVVVVVA